MKVCTSSQMHLTDENASKKFNIPGIVLMENAAISCANQIKGFSNVVIVCGLGNNGGDGFAIARHLLLQGKAVTIYALFGNGYKGDAKTNFDILATMGIEIKPFHKEGFEKDVKGADCVVDAIFGTGFHGEASGIAKDAIEIINRFAKYVLAVDVPSGINPDTGEVLGEAVRANETITFAAYKSGMLMYPAADFCGKITVAYISIPENAYEGAVAETLDREYVSRIMPKRQKNSQKGDYGKLLVIGGSVGMAGAVCLACEAAFKVGIGTVTACVPSEINDIVQINSPKAMTIPVNFNKDKQKIIEVLNNYDVVLFGNGIGREDHIVDLLEKILENTKVPVVIDADGLFALSKNPDMLKKCSTDIVLTPHSMEMARLIGKDVDFVEKNRLSVSKEFVLSYGLTLVLKGNHSIITAPNVLQRINLTGNSGMATAGSGDVLAGMTAGFLAVCNPPCAAALAVNLHGAAGDFAKEKFCEYSLTATDLLDAIPHILPVEKI